MWNHKGRGIRNESLHKMIGIWGPTFKSAKLRLLTCACYPSYYTARWEKERRESLGACGLDGLDVQYLTIKRLFIKKGSWKVIPCLVSWRPRTYNSEWITALMWTCSRSHTCTHIYKMYILKFIMAEENR